MEWIIIAILVLVFLFTFIPDMSDQTGPPPKSDPGFPRFSSDALSGEPPSADKAAKRSGLPPTEV